jgi:Uma2 family endonuclease
MDTVLREPWTVEGFLAWEDRQEVKHEFDGQRALPMTGGSRAHQRIIFNLLTLLTARVAPGYDVVQEMRVRIGTKVRYPDVCVCAGPIPQATRTLTDAVAIFEALSEETAAADRGAKLGEYAGLPGIRYYVLLEQDRIDATVHRLEGGRWEAATLSGGMLLLPEIGVELAANDVYSGLRF